MTAASAHDGPAPARPGGRFPWLVWTVRALALAYPLALLTAIAAFRLVGERWWLTTLALYLPRAAFALPLPVLIVVLAVARAPRLLALQALSAILVVFPLMGLRTGGDQAAQAGTTRFRIFTGNIGLASEGVGPVLARIRAANADVIGLEEVAPQDLPALRAGLPGYAFRYGEQFVVASRFPIESVTPPPVLQTGEGTWDSAHYLKCRLRTPGGPVALYVVHPISPHQAFNLIRGDLLAGILSGDVFGAPYAKAAEANTAQRLAQIATVAADAYRSPDPVLIAGDTNLPGDTWAFARWFGRYQDAFAKVGRGFGYTYPADHLGPWMRIDRVLADRRFVFLHAAVTAAPLALHHGLTADLELAPAR
jgi:endonuclease/exonuclease/phosphatase (EEP) superfamily protein YafD